MEGNRVELLGSCSYGDQLYIFSLYNEMSLMNMFDYISKRWPEVNPEFCILKYAAPHNKLEVSLNDDGDVANMISLHICWKQTIVDIIAIRKNQRNIRGPQSISTSREIVLHESEVTQTNSLDSWRRCIHGVGQTFKDAHDFRKHVKNYAIATKRSFKYKKNDSVKVNVLCSDANCGWRIYASRYKADNSFAIRKCYLIHTCGEDNLRSRGHPRADSPWVSNIIRDKLRDEPCYRPCIILKDIHRDYGLQLSYRKAWAGKEIAMHDIHGVDRDSYDKLRWYCNAVVETNPGSIADCEISPDTQKFRRLFICLHACISGFLAGCRPLIFLDGTFIKNKFKGCLLSAVCKDANDDLFTIAYAVVDAENDVNWEWFCSKLRDTLISSGVSSFARYTFFSDRSSGLLKALPMLFPGSHQAYCLRHLVDNFKKTVLRKYPKHNKLYWSSVFNKAAYAPTRQEYDRHINAILESMPLAREFIMTSQPQCWANSLFSGDRWGVINNNQAECWNNWVKLARFMPAVAMVDHIRKQIMTMMHDRREEVSKFPNKLCPKPEMKLVINYSASRTLKIDQSSSWTFEVCDADKTCAVNLQSRTCSCREWQISKIPCKHACACIETKKLSVYDFCDAYYQVGMYKQAYCGIINPIPNFDHDLLDFPRDGAIHAPDVRAQPGRRRTERRESQVFVRDRKCKTCGRKGHNRRTCKGV